MDIVKNFAKANNAKYKYCDIKFYTQMGIVGYALTKATYIGTVPTSMFESKYRNIAEEFHCFDLKLNTDDKLSLDCACRGNRNVYYSHSLDRIYINPKYIVDIELSRKENK